MRLINYFLAILIFLPGVSFATVLEVKISGVNKAIETSIRNDLHLQQAITEPKLTSARIRNLYQLAPEQITSVLQANGYYNSKVTEELIRQPGDTVENDQWLASFVITLGEPTTIKSINIEVSGPGKDNPKIKSFYNTPKLMKGKIITHENYENSKEELLTNFNSIGYLQANFTQHILEIDRHNNTADIKLTIDTGVQYRFGKITFIDSVYPDSFLLRFAPFKTGDPYELQKLIDFQKNLEQADLFNKIRFDPLNDLSDPHNTVIPINVRIYLKPHNRYTGSVGYGTDTGARASLSWLHRFTSTPGHRAITDIYTSQRRSTARANYIIPGTQPATDKYVFGALGQTENFEELFSRKAEVSGSRIIKRGKIESMYGLWYFTETYRIVHGSPTLNKKYLLPTAKWIWIDHHDTDEFELGNRLDLKVRFGAKALFSDHNVAQIEANAKKIFPLTDKTRFLARSTIGAVASQEFSNLPPSLRFFTGGDDTVRGFAYNSLGPLANPQDKDSTTGGRYLFIISGELERRIYHEFSGVIFYDAGNTALSTKIPLAMGAGAGVRYKTAIGSFKFDLAKPLNDVTNKHWRVHINFGADL